MPAGSKGLWQQLHPATLLGFIFIEAILVLVINHPLVLALFLISTCCIVLVNNGREQLKGYLLLVAFMALSIIIINPLVNPNGSTLLWRAPRWPLLGGVRITAEALVYGGVMALRIANVILLFALYNLVLHPDRAMTFFSRVLPKSGLTLALTVRLIPHFRQRAVEIEDVQYLRGVRYDRGGRAERIRRRLPLLKVLVLSSLEEGLDAAEAMRARGYGAAKRTAYARERFSLADGIIWSDVVLLAAAVALLTLAGNKVTFFPRLTNVGFDAYRWEMLTPVLLLLILPLLADWGWRRWHYAGLRR